jgi:hypothetical protein
MRIKKITTSVYEIDGIKYDDKNEAKIAWVRSQLTSMFSSVLADDGDVTAAVDMVLSQSKPVFNMMMAYNKHSAVLKAETAAATEPGEDEGNGEEQQEAA